MGTLFEDQSLYKKVREHLKVKNIYLFKKILECNGEKTQNVEVDEVEGP